MVENKDNQHATIVDVVDFDNRVTTILDFIDMAFASILIYFLSLPSLSSNLPLGVTFAYSG